ncbi:pantoate kinase [Candidatus Nitrosocosmicus franklandus]|uniref:Pantoate kinase n=1 Tax=Candidatus Nitrosocosmicus franklandianus TaxID=1798806 RepID=A0A484IE21_9ARCH|nr:hypothetical protein [Candidatus Nitrosocosmicus franklandus]VFJ14997.1 Shikimate kinase [Candidatus Nitrosocosmicus franklandus]
MVIVSQVPIAVSKAYCPGHVTGFFSAQNQGDPDLDFKFQGSLGAGFSIDRGIISTVRVFPSSDMNYEIKLNGMLDCELRVSKYVTEYYLSLIQKPVLISIDHESNLPIGYGLGSSGSAALGLSYALNEALGTGLSSLQAAQMAHQADIVCNTGRGTVVSEYTGGVELRTSIGGPGVCRIQKTELSSEWCAVILCMEPIKTDIFLSKYLGGSKFSNINEVGKQMVKQLGQSMSVEKFMDFSFKFASLCGLTEGKCKEPLAHLRSKGLKSSVALFGHTLFTLIPNYQLGQVIDILKRYQGELIICHVDNLGARILKKVR